MVIEVVLVARDTESGETLIHGALAQTRRARSEEHQGALADGCEPPHRRICRGDTACIAGTHTPVVGGSATERREGDPSGGACINPAGTGDRARCETILITGSALT